ncbi:MAG TPA: PAS domain S-box protein, partial [Anaerolineales bacterium]|nr:PAS domain S-box protein [Anaerolineales bacterium]
PQLPVIVMTGHADEELGTQAVQAGAQDYLIKGRVDGRLLTRAIQYAIQRKRIELQLADAREFTERIVGSSPVGIFTYRLSGECLTANAAAAQMVGGKIEQLTSQNFHQIESWKPSGLYSMAQKAITERTMVTGDVHVHTSFGKEAWYQAQFTTFRSGGEELLLMMFVDVTERKQMEEALRQREALLQQTQAISHIGSWDLDLLENRLTWSDEVYRIFGLEPRIFEGTYEAFLTAVHPDDRAKVDESYSQSVRQGLDGYEIQHRIIRQDTGEVRYVLEKCENSKDASGKIVRSVGMVQDITERWKSEVALQASERFNRATLDALTANIAILDESGTIVAVNRSWREFARANGITPQQVSEGVNYLAVCDTAAGPYAEEAKDMADGIRAVLRGEEQSFAIEYPCHSPDEKRWFFGRVTRFQEGPLRIVVAHEYITERKLAEEALRESEENYRQLFEAESDAILLIDNATGQVLQANHAACALYGYSQEQLLSKKNIDLSAEPEQTRQVTAETPVVPEQVISIPLRFHRRKDGSIFPVEITGRFFIHQGRPVHIAAVRDITERKHAEAALEASEKRFRTWIEHSSDLVTVLDVNGTIHYQSPSSKHLLGYEPEELVNTGALDLLHPDDREMIIARFFETMQGVEASSLAECRVRHRDGTWRFLEAVGRTFVDEHGEMVALINSRDVTERKKAEAEVAAIQKRFQSLIENAPDGIALLGLHGKLRQVTPSTYQILGYTREESEGQDPGVLTHPADLPAVLEQLNEVLQDSGKVARIQYRFKHKDGSWRWLDSTISNLIAEPSVQAIVFNYRDITERRELEEQLRQSEATLRSFYESAPNLMGITELVGDDDILHVYDNPATCRFFGVAKDSTNGKLSSELGVPPAVLQEWIRHYRESERLGMPVHFEYLHEDGRQTRWLSVTAAVIPNTASARTRFCYVAEEVTERKQAEEKIVLQANLLAAVGSAAIATDLQGHVIYWNAAAEKLYGWTASEAIGKLITELTPSEQSQVQAQEIMQHMLAGHAWSGEFTVKRKDESRFPAFVSNSPFLDSTGKLIGFIGVSNDISELKNAEAALRASEQRYRDLAENFPNGVVSVYNREFQMVFDAGLELKASGYRAEDFIGKHFAELTTPETWRTARPHLQEAFDGKVSMYEAQGLDGQYYRVNVAPLYDSNEEINEILVVSQNVTNLKITELALREKEHLLSEAQRIGQIGSWSY